MLPVVPAGLTTCDTRLFTLLSPTPTLLPYVLVVKSPMTSVCVNRSSCPSQFEVMMFPSGSVIVVFGQAVVS